MSLLRDWVIIGALKLICSFGVAAVEMNIAIFQRIIVASELCPSGPSSITFSSCLRRDAMTEVSVLSG